jgi:hypothetical protein
VEFLGRDWVADEPSTDATNAPLDFGGIGEMRQETEASAVYKDDASGKVIRFSPLVGEYDPPPCA